MRWLLRLLLFWAISGPLFYLFGLPLLLEELSNKTRKENYTQCNARLKEEGTVGTPNSPLVPAQGDNYCHCVSDALTFTKEDILDMVQKKPPRALTLLAQTLAHNCTRNLHESMGLLPPKPAQPEGEKRDPNVIYF